jgi:hypothetical protein
VHTEKVCDASRAEIITFAEIITLEKALGIFSTKLKSQCNLIRQINSNSDKRRYFFLQKDDSILSFKQEMLVDFRSIIRVKRQECLQIIEYRRGKLNDEGRSHFREKIAHYYKQYAVDE